ncbi:MAG: glutamine synthetase [Gemmatimonadota bacterium]|nr:glutamine synthetase [Gemmatimonadota bacterium]
MEATGIGEGGEGHGRLDLQETIGKPRSEWTVDDIVSLFHSGRLRGLGLMHVGGDGLPKRLDFVPRDFRHFQDIVTAGERADGSSLFPGSGIPAGASDILLRPRVETGFLDPFAGVPTLVLLCGHVRPDGTPLPQSPDTIVRRAAARLEDATGCGLHAFGEVEYFVGRRGVEQDVPEGADRGYHASAPHVFGEAMRRRALDLLVAMGVPVKYGHSEVGRVEPRDADDLLWEQHEIELAPAPLPEAADGVVLTRWILRSLARREGYRFSVDPILARGHAGNGLHFHLTPTRDGVPVEVEVTEGSLADPARWLIGGLVELGAALMAFGNRGRGSLLRLSQAKEAPGALTWGAHDRSALVRLPARVRTEQGRAVHPATVEFRLPDGSAAPHLLLAGVAVAMREGARSRELDEVLRSASVGEAKRNGGAAHPVPATFQDVVVALAEVRDRFEAEDVFPAGLVDRALADLRRAEERSGAEDAG